MIASRPDVTTTVTTTKPDPPERSADDLLAEIARRYADLRVIWRTRSHSHEAQSILMAEIRGLCGQYRALEKAGKIKKPSRAVSSYSTANP